MSAAMPEQLLPTDYDAALETNFGWSRARRLPLGSPPDGIREQTEAPLQVTFTILGQPLRFHTNSEALLQAAHLAFGRFPAASDPDQRPLLIRLLVHPTPAGLPAAHDPLYRLQGHLLYLSCGAANTAVADLQHGFAMGFLTPELAADLEFVRYVFIECLGYSMCAAARQMIPLHAGGVVRHGRAFILAGASGAGKSTLSLAALEHGYHLLTENTVFVKPSPTSSEPELWGAPWKLHLLDDSRRFFPALEQAHPELQVNGRRKWIIDIEEYRPGALAYRARPGAVLFLQRRVGGAGARLVPLSKAAALERMEVVYPYWNGWTPAMQAALETLAAGPAYLLENPGDPHQALPLLDQLAAELQPEGA